MSIYSNVTEKDLNILRKVAEQQKNQRALRIKNRILKQTHDIKLAERLSPITKNLGTIIESTKQLGELVKKSDVEDGNTQTPAIENITGTQSLRDTLSVLKKSKIFFKLGEKGSSKVFRNKDLIKPLGKSKISIKDQEYDINPNIQTYFTNTKLTTKTMNEEYKSTVYDILKNTGFYSMRHNRGLHLSYNERCFVYSSKIKS